MSFFCSFLKCLSALVLLFPEYKGKEADSKSVGKILAGNDVQNSTLGCKTSSKEQSLLRPRVSKNSEATVYLDFAE